MRVTLIVIALVLDGLCLALMVAASFLTRTTTSELLGFGIFAVVISSNLPPLIWAVRSRKRPDATAGVFD
jgi:hypothetical protein